MADLRKRGWATVPRLCELVLQSVGWHYRVVLLRTLHNARILVGCIRIIKGALIVAGGRAMKGSL